MKQQCHISMIYLSWLVYVGGVALSVWYSRWLLAVLLSIAVPAIQWLYIRKFPSLSAGMGYGPITDRPATSVDPAPVEVTLYTALGCPFCPLLERRLESLREEMNFALKKIDVTLRPDLLASKGIRSVPALEVQGQFFLGLASTRDLAAAIARAVPQSSAARPVS